MITPDMITVRFEGPDGVVTARAAPGARLLDVAQSCGQPLEGTCDGQMACSTCHVIVTPDGFDSLPRASDDEEALLDMTRHATRTSRLACQILLTEAHDGLTVRLPPDGR